MPFMEPQVEFGTWYVIDGPVGTDFVPSDLVGQVTATKPDGRQVARPPTIDELREFDREQGTDPEGPDAVRFPVPSALSDFCENRECWSVTVRTGWGARWSAPGFLDCTQWTVFDTRDEAEAYLRDMEDDR